MNKIRNNNGTLTVYGFACGYIERKKRGGVEVDLYRDGAVWHVTARDDERGRFVWECFDLLTPARKFQAQTIRALKH